MAEATREHRRYLTRLDSKIGDHGTNMNRGFAATRERLDGAEPAIPVGVKTVATALIGKVGGAAGPLYGTAFPRASAVLPGKDQVSAAEATIPLTARRGRRNWRARDSRGGGRGHAGRGDPEGGLGTDPERIQAAVEVLVFVDSGSAALSAGAVLEMLSSGSRD